MRTPPFENIESLIIGHLKKFITTQNQQAILAVIDKLEQSQEQAEEAGISAKGSIQPEMVEDLENAHQTHQADINKILFCVKRLQYTTHTLIRFNNAASLATSLQDSLPPEADINEILRGIAKSFAIPSLDELKNYESRISTVRESYSSGRVCKPDSFFKEADSKTLPKEETLKPGS